MPGIRPTPDCGARNRPKEQRHSGCSENDSRADERTSRHAAISVAAGPRGTGQTARGDVQARGRGAGADGQTRRRARRPGGTTGQHAIRRHRARQRRSGQESRGPVSHQRSPLALGSASGSGALQSGKCGTTCSARGTPHARGEHSTRCRLRIDPDLAVEVFVPNPCVPSRTAKAYRAPKDYGAKWRGAFAFVDGLGTPEPRLNRRHRARPAGGLAECIPARSECCYRLKGTALPRLTRRAKSASASPHRGSGAH